ncbi:MAG: shikimate kinase [Chloroflexota bacterium]
MSENSIQNIVLTGFMGTGKSTVGQSLAAELGWVFFDVDTAIEHRTGLTIPRIFANFSEPFFRAIEKGICHEIALQKNLVVATGGGAIVDDDSRKILLETSFVICLLASPEAVEERLQASDARPLAGEWRRLYDERLPIYEAMPNKIDTTDKTIAQVTQEARQLWQNASA